MIGGAGEEERTEGGGRLRRGEWPEGWHRWGGTSSGHPWQWEARSYAAQGSLTRCARWRDRDCGGVVDAAEGLGPCGMLRTREGCGRGTVAWSPGHGQRRGSVAGGRG